MRVVSVALRDFRSYERAQVDLGEGLTVVAGPNGAGKTNLLEAIYLSSTGRSCRTTNDREVVRFGAPAFRLSADFEAGDGSHTVTVGFSPGEPKRMTMDGAEVERLVDHPHRPLMSVFLPDRLEVVKGVPALRRAHLDQLVAALWPARIATRRGYNQVLAQRNALLARIRSGVAAKSALDGWDEQLANHAVELMADRDAAVGLVAPLFSEMCARLGLDGDAALRYRRRSRATDAATFARELGERVAADVERGFTAHGPHRDELLLSFGGRELRTYGSQGQQRVGLLAMLLAERVVVGETRSAPPILLLDDVMSELDRDRRSSLVDVVGECEGQVVITTTDVDHVPCGERGEPVTTVTVSAGSRLDDPVGARGDW